MGYTYEVDLHFWVKRSWALAGAWGARAYHLARIEAAVIREAPIERALAAAERAVEARRAVHVEVGGECAGRLERQRLDVERRRRGRSMASDSATQEQGS